MKKVLLALVAVSSFIACKRDDDKTEVKPQEPTIVGVWKQTKFVVYNGKDNSVIREESPKTECEKKSSIEFTKDGKMMTRSFTMHEGNCIEDGSENGTYTYDATKKILIANIGKRGQEDIEVLSLTSDELQVLEGYSDKNGDKIEDKMVIFLSRQR